jgi:uncharacterized membrane protein
MTLRELFEKAHLAYEVFVFGIKSDINSATNVSLIDWPIYLLLLGLLAALIIWIFIQLALSFCNIAWTNFWKKHYDKFGRPTTTFGRFENFVSELMGRAGSLLLIWFLAYVFIYLILDIADLAKSIGADYLKFGIPTLFCGIIAILAKIGRNHSEREGKNNSDFQQ